MKCSHARRLFGAYWDDELTQAEREWLESHFVSCAACRGEYEELARTVGLLGELPRVEVSPAFADRVLVQARRRSPAADRLLLGAPRWVAVTATAVLLAVLGGMVMQWTGTPLAPRRTVSVGADRTAVLEAERIAPEPTRPQVEVADPVDPELMAVGSADSLFDPSGDVEFILDSVTLRKGRAHTVVRVPAEPARGEPAVITF